MARILHSLYYFGKSCFIYHKNLLYLLYSVPLHFLENSWEGEQEHNKETKPTVLK